jgi:hypothetical protein
MAHAYLIEGIVRIVSVSDRGPRLTLAQLLWRGDCCLIRRGHLMHHSKPAVQLLMTVTGFIAVPQAKAQAQSGSTFHKANDIFAEEMYPTYCASCGIDGKDSGPAAALKKRCQFSDFRLTHIIDWCEVQAAHSSQGMPFSLRSRTPMV